MNNACIIYASRFALNVVRALLCDGMHIYIYTLVLRGVNREDNHYDVQQ